MEYKVEVLEKAVKTYGYVHQTTKAAEELSELLVALNKWLGMSENEDYIRDNIKEECADVEIMLGQCDKQFAQFFCGLYRLMHTTISFNGLFQYLYFVLHLKFPPYTLRDSC